MGMLIQIEMNRQDSLRMSHAKAQMDFRFRAISCLNDENWKISFFFFNFNRLFVCNGWWISAESFQKFMRHQTQIYIRKVLRFITERPRIHRKSSNVRNTSKTWIWTGKYLVEIHMLSPLEWIPSNNSHSTVKSEYKWKSINVFSPASKLQCTQMRNASIEL